MKIQVSQLANGRWVCECRKWYWVRWPWRLPYFVAKATPVSVAYGAEAQELKYATPGTPLYPALSFATKREAHKVYLEVCAYYGERL